MQEKKSKIVVKLADNKNKLVVNQLNNILDKNYIYGQEWNKQIIKELILQNLTKNTTCELIEELNNRCYCLGVNMKSKRYKIKWLNVVLFIGIIIASMLVIMFINKVNNDTEQAYNKCRQEHGKNYCDKLILGIYP